MSRHSVKTHEIITNIVIVTWFKNQDRFKRDRKQTILRIARGGYGADTRIGSST